MQILTRGLRGSVGFYIPSKLLGEAEALGSHVDSQAADTRPLSPMSYTRAVFWSPAAWWPRVPLGYWKCSK